MEFIKPTVFTVPKNFVEFFTALDKFTDTSGEELWLLLDCIEERKTDFNDYIKFEYEE